jgi:hypothetical protein
MSPGRGNGLPACWRSGARGPRRGGARARRRAERCCWAARRRSRGSPSTAVQTYNATARGDQPRQPASARAEGRPSPNIAGRSRSIRRLCGANRRPAMHPRRRRSGCGAARGACPHRRAMHHALGLASSRRNSPPKPQSAAVAPSSH